MSIENVREFFSSIGREDEILEFSGSSATVALAAKALGTEEARIAKTLSFKVNDTCVLIVAAGDARLDNPRYKALFHTKATMLSPEECLAMTGHEPGGICPFCNPAGTKIYLDRSLMRYDYVYPACGSANSAIKLTCGDLFALSGADGWIDLCKGWQPKQEA